MSIREKIVDVVTFVKFSTGGEQSADAGRQPPGHRPFSQAGSRASSHRPGGSAGGVAALSEEQNSLETGQPSGRAPKWQEKSPVHVLSGAHKSLHTC